jgi:hypothetical protein
MRVLNNILKSKANIDNQNLEKQVKTEENVDLTQSNTEQSALKNELDKLGINIEPQKLKELEQYMKSKGLSVKDVVNVVELTMSIDLEPTKENIDVFINALKNGSNALSKATKNIEINLENLISFYDSDSLTDPFTFFDEEDNVTDISINSNKFDQPKNKSAQGSVYFEKKESVDLDFGEKNGLLSEEDIYINKQNEELENIELKVLDINVEEVVNSFSSSKIFERTTITPKMKNLSKDFEIFNKSTIDLLERIKSLKHSNDFKKVEENLDEVIRKWDNFFKSSKVFLYSDMKFEKEVLKINERIQSAKININDKNNNIELDEAIDLMKKLDFKPKKVENFVKTFTIKLNGDTENIKPRKIMDTLRAIGIDSESKIVDMIENGDWEKLENFENLKTFLAKKQNTSSLTKDEKLTLDYINALNLGFKVQDNKTSSNFTLEIPMESKSLVKSMEVNINISKDDKGSFDWRNSNVYFLLDLNESGILGLRVNTVDANTYLSFESDSFKIRKGLENSKETIIDRMSQIGYKVENLSIRVMTKSKEMNSSQEVSYEI